VPYRTGDLARHAHVVVIDAPSAPLINDPEIALLLRTSLGNLRAERDARHGA
jgi:hypothetical protein